MVIYLFILACHACAQHFSFWSLSRAFTACDPRATFWFLLRSICVCSSRSAPHHLGLCCTATTVLLSACRVSIVLTLFVATHHWRVVSHHHHRLLHRHLLLPDLVSSLTFLVDCVSPAPRDLRPRVVVYGVCSIMMTFLVCFHWLIVLACF
ncbi:hypothetical protein ACOSQ3_031720 [Xanthoceras sorbifolium]